MTATTASSSAPTLRTPHDLLRPSPQVKIWAALGVMSLALVSWGWVRWFLSGDFKSSPAGADDISTAGLVYLRFFEIAFSLIAAYFVWRWLIKPLRRERTLGLDGMMILASFLAWWYDPITTDYVNFTFAYNSHLWNFGSWVEYIPGWVTPGAGRFPEPVLFIGTSYIWWLWGTVLIGCAALRWLRRRWPNMSNLGLFTILGLVILPFDFLVEVILMVLPGVYAYPGVIGKLSFFAGTRHQFPMYEPILVSFFSIGMILPRWFRDDRGRSFVERGVDDLRLRNKGKKLVSFLALTGYIHVVVLVAYTIPWNLIAVKADTFGPVPSYLRGGGICGDGTPYACPDTLVPLARKGSLNIAPDDPRLPADLRTKQTTGRAVGP